MRFLTIFILLACVLGLAMCSLGGGGDYEYRYESRW